MARKKRAKKKESRAERRARIHQEYEAQSTRVHMNMADLTIPWVLHRVMHDFIVNNNRSLYWDHETKKLIRDHLREAARLTRTPSGVPDRAWDLGRAIEKKRQSRKLLMPYKLGRLELVQEDVKSRVYNKGAGGLSKRRYIDGKVEDSIKTRIEALNFSMHNKASTVGVEVVDADAVPQVFLTSEWTGGRLNLRVPRGYERSVVRNRLGVVEGKIVLEAWKSQQLRNVFEVRFLDFTKGPDTCEIRRGLVRIRPHAPPSFIKQERAGDEL